MTGGKILWAMDADGEIGKQPKPGPGTFEISGESYVLLMADLAGRGKGKRK